jgi:hypothetical protein
MLSKKHRDVADGVLKVVGQYLAETASDVLKTYETMNKALSQM